MVTVQRNFSKCTQKWPSNFCCSWNTGVFPWNCVNTLFCNVSSGPRGRGLLHQFRVANLCLTVILHRGKVRRCCWYCYSRDAESFTILAPSWQWLKLLLLHWLYCMENVTNFSVITIHLKQEWQLESVPGFESHLGCSAWVPEFGLKHCFCFSSGTNPQLSRSGFVFQQSMFLPVSESAKSLWYHSVIKYMQNGKQILILRQTKIWFIKRDCFCFTNLWICLLNNLAKHWNVLSSAASTRFSYGVLRFVFEDFQHLTTCT